MQTTRSQISLQEEKQNPRGIRSESAKAGERWELGPRDLGSEEDCTDPPICPGDDEIGASGGGKSADEDGDEDEEGGVVERQQRRVCDSARVFHPPSTLLIPCRCSPHRRNG